MGPRSGYYLYSHDGNVIGKFHEDELYDTSGKYIGEIRNDNRIIVNRTKNGKRKSGFAKLVRCVTT